MILVAALLFIASLLIAWDAWKAWGRMKAPPAAVKPVVVTGD
jgi:hypothetical protein